MIDSLLKTITNAAGLTTYRIGLLQTKAYRILNQETAKALKAHKITPVDWALLGLLYEQKKGIRLSDLANELGVEAPFVTERAQDLVKLQLITITTSSNDKRVKHMELTQSAREKIPLVEKELISIMYPLLKGSSLPDLRGYKHVLEHIVNNKPSK